MDPVGVEMIVKQPMTCPTCGRYGSIPSEERKCAVDICPTCLGDGCVESESVDE
jgi:hypothetical protein